MDEIEDFTTENERVSSIEDAPKEGMDKKVGSIASFVESAFDRSEEGRRQDETRWLQAYRNYRGIYGPDVQFSDEERSRVFVKVTKTKVQAAYSQVIDVLLGSTKFPLTVDPTTLPEGVEESVHFSTEDTPQLEEMPALEPGETRSVYERLSGALKNKLKPVAQKIELGEGTTPSDVTIHPAMMAAKKMEKKIHDQLEETAAKKELRRFAFDMCLYGTGVFNGPFLEEKEYAKWDDEGEYDPIIKTIPKATAVNIWDFYNDPDAMNMEDAEFAIRRHKISRTQLRKLKRRPFFRANAIDAVLLANPDYTEKWWESQLDDDNSDPSIQRYEALEYWGFLDIESIREQGVEIPKELEDEDELSVNVWVCGGQVLRLVLNPFKPAYIPFFVAPYENNPGSFFGVGVAENMDDTQTLMNGFMRLAVDNAVLSGNVMLEVDVTNLEPSTDFKMKPGKIWKRQSGVAGQAVNAIQIPNISNQNMQMFDKARVLADESTGFPSFAHGQTGVTGVGRTASGISMLMGAAAGSIRTVIKNIDDYLLAPLGQAFFRFNMQFDFDEEIKGDLEVKAQGTNSLMANEVKSQRLMQFLSLVQNPTLAPFAKMEYIVREIARSMDLDPDKVVNSLADSAIQAEIMKKLAPQDAAPPGAEGGPPSPNDTQGSGDGNIGTGSVPNPGEAGFSANTGEQT